MNVWANSEGQKPIVTNPYTDRAKVIALEKGTRTREYGSMERPTFFRTTKGHSESTDRLLPVFQL